ncbi:cbb3-type cytochrome oxidase assembly protein CcoS [Pedomonas sp. V897]|uniref:cbb3-type cytochrome oxidase assembly protein CcoS n=1 Tax=Pedomonas sp. V897 TaxID=3446482 RepID=UPI003EE0A1FE
MTGLPLLIILALAMGLAWLGLFMWTLRSHQYDDPEGAALRILAPDDDTPAPRA